MPIDLRFAVADRLLTMAARFAASVSYPLDDWSARARTEYVRAYQDKGMSLEQIARRAAKSRRTIATLSSQQKEQKERPDYSPTSIRSALVRVVSNKPGITLPQVAKTLGLSPDKIRPELEVMVEDGVFEQNKKGYLVPAEVVQFSVEDTESRLAFLGQFLNSITRIIEARFVKQAPGAESLARVFLWTQLSRRQQGMATVLIDSLRELTSIEDKQAQVAEPHERVEAALCLGLFVEANPNKIKD